MMDNQQDHLSQIKDIRQMMLGSSRFISLSGLAGIFSGIFGLVGGLIAYWKIHIDLDLIYYSSRDIIVYAFDRELILFLMADAAVVLILSLVSAIYFTTRKAKKEGRKTWDKVTLQMLVNLAIPLMAGGIFCLFLVEYSLLKLVPPTTLIFYGLALLNASKYTLDEIKYLGLSEIVLGLIGCYFWHQAILIWAIGFGILHIFYGTLMFYRYERRT